MLTNVDIGISIVHWRVGMKSRLRGAVEKVTLAAFSVFITLIVLEVGVRILVPQDTRFFDSSTFLRVASTAPFLHENIPHGKNDSYVQTSVSINSLGLRGDEVPLRKKNGTIRIIGLGDSVTFGYGIRLEDTFLHVLQDKLNRLPNRASKYEVLNAGVGATGLDYYYYYLSTRANILRPDIVILNICLNDIQVYSPLESRTQPNQRKYLDRVLHNASRFLLRHSQLYLLMFMRLKSFLYSVGILDINTIQGGNYLAVEPPSPQQNQAWDASLQMLGRIVELARREPYRLILVVFPMEMQVSANSLRLYQDKFHMRLSSDVLAADPQRRLQEFGSRNGVVVVDLLPAFRASDTDRLFLRNKSITFDPVHPSPLGHQIAAGEIFAALARRYPDPKVLGTTAKFGNLKSK